MVEGLLEAYNWDTYPKESEIFKTFDVKNKISIFGQFGPKRVIEDLLEV